MNYKKTLEFINDNFTETEIFAKMYANMYLETGNLEFAIISAMIIEELSNR